MISRFLRTRFLPLLLLGATFPGLARSEPPRTGFEFATRYAHSATSSIVGGSGPGSVGVDSWHLGLRTSTALTEATQLLYGLDWSRHALDLTGTAWLPDQLQAVAVPLGVTHRWNDQWRLLVTLQPRLAAAESGFSSSGFDLPVLALASYTANPELTWSFGFRHSARSDVPLLPLVGVAWKFAPGWDFKLAWPDSGVSYQATPPLTLRAVAAFHGGDYRLADDPRNPANRSGPSLQDAWLEYRELRLGLAAEYAVGRSVSLRADLGKVVSQRFDYVDRGHTLRGANPTYLALSVAGRF